MALTIPGVPGLFKRSSNINDKTTIIEKREAGSVSYHPSIYMPKDGITINDIEYYNSYILANANIEIIGAVEIPDNSVIVRVIVYGNAGATTKDWKLVRWALDGSGLGTTIATAKINTAKKAEEIVDNSKYSYSIEIAGLVATNQIYGTQIDYSYSLSGSSKMSLGSGGDISGPGGS